MDSEQEKSQLFVRDVNTRFQCIMGNQVFLFRL